MCSSFPALIMRKVTGPAGTKPGEGEEKAKSRATMVTTGGDTPGRAGLVCTGTNAVATTSRRAATLDLKEFLLVSLHHELVEHSHLRVELRSGAVREDAEQHVMAGSELHPDLIGATR